MALNNLASLLLDPQQLVRVYDYHERDYVYKGKYADIPENLCDEEIMAIENTANKKYLTIHIDTYWLSKKAREIL